MNAKPALFLTCLLTLTAVLIPFAVLAEISVGVKAGDWTETTVKYHTEIPKENYVESTKTEILSVKGTVVTANCTLNRFDGSTTTLTAIQDLSKPLDSIIVVPTNLNVGDTLQMERFDVTIEGVEQRTYAGVERTVVYGTIQDVNYYWDQATGILLEDSQILDGVIHHTTKVEKTNIFQTQQTAQEDLPTVYITLGILAAIAVIVVIFILRRRKTA